MKLLYYLDFIHFRETGKSVTGLDYFAWDFGPYPLELGTKINEGDAEIDEYLRILKNEEHITIIPKKSFQNRFFSKRELRILEETAFIFRDVIAKEISEISHLKNQPWDITLKEKGEKAKIDYFLALEENSPPKSDIIENIQDRIEIERVFG